MYHLSGSCSLFQIRYVWFQAWAVAESKKSEIILLPVWGSGVKIECVYLVGIVVDFERMLISSSRSLDVPGIGSPFQPSSRWVSIFSSKLSAVTLCSSGGRGIKRWSNVLDGCSGNRWTISCWVYGSIMMLYLPWNIPTGTERSVLRCSTKKYPSSSRLKRATLSIVALFEPQAPPGCSITRYSDSKLPLSISEISSIS